MGMKYVDCRASGLRALLMRTTTVIYVLTEEEFFRMGSEENFPWFKKFINDWKVAVPSAYFTISVQRRRTVQGGRSQDRCYK